MLDKEGAGILFLVWRYYLIYPNGMKVDIMIINQHKEMHCHLRCDMWRLALTVVHRAQATTTSEEPRNRYRAHISNDSHLTV